MTSSNWKALAATVLLAALLLAACDVGPSSPPAAGGKPLVVATTPILRSMAQAVAGDVADVRSILPLGADPHEFDPKPNDVAAISNSALVLKNGLKLDDWIDRIIQNAGGSRPIVTVSEGAALRKGDSAEPLGDPHIWFDVTNAMTMTRNIRDGLVKADAPHEAQYTANAEAYLVKLKELDEYIKAQIGALPEDKRKIVTNHDAFGYYVARYGLTYVGAVIPSMSTQAQPSAGEVAALTRKIKDQSVKAIFVEQGINPSLAQQIARDAGVKVVDTLYADTLAAEGPASTYEGMMRFDTETIVSALK
jgi:ABC-type Zn uptake system ZnuABC Zn-binding protein ZnuA